jgi:hypothetical protein
MNDFLSIMLGMACGILIGMVIMTTGGKSHGTIIGKGYGLYCPDTGDFAFTGECE